MREDETGTTKIPDKLYFRIGEVSRIAGVPPYVLRFWETEFKQIRPKRSDSGQRLYRRRDVARVLKVKHLLYERRFTIEGARKHMIDRRPKAMGAPRAITPSEIDEIRQALIGIRDLIDNR